MENTSEKKDNKLYMVITSWCPYCQRSLKWMENMMMEDEKYRDLEIEVIDEEQNPKAASKYTYELVPNFHLNDEKIFEGAATEKDVREVMEKAYKAQHGGN